MGRPKEAGTIQVRVPNELVPTVISLKQLRLVNRSTPDVYREHYTKIKTETDVMISATEAGVQPKQKTKSEEPEQVDWLE